MVFLVFLKVNKNTIFLVCLVIYLFIVILSKTKVFLITVARSFQACRLVQSETKKKSNSFQYYGIKHNLSNVSQTRLTLDVHVKGLVEEGPVDVDLTQVSTFVLTHGVFGL